MQLRNKKTPLVSVIVPAYNEEKHIEQCLVSLKSQKYHQLELIVVDDGSADKTKTIAKKYADVLLSQKHLGPGTARNKAAKIAKGEILVFADADMYFEENYVANIIKPIVLGMCKATFTNEEYVANANNVWVRCGTIDNNLPQGKRYGALKESVVARAIIRKFFLHIGGMRPELGMRDDHILDQEKALPAKGAVCYHYNPETLWEVFTEGRWTGRNPLIALNMPNLLRYSIINSFIISVKKIVQGSTIMFFLYKCTFDFGVFTGILTKQSANYFAK